MQNHFHSALLPLKLLESNTTKVMNLLQTMLLWSLVEINQQRTLGITGFYLFLQQILSPMSYLYVNYGWGLWNLPVANEKSEVIFFT